MKQTDFFHANTSEPHRERTKQILREHPEVRELIGKNPASFWYTLGLVTLQIILAFLLRAQPWWIVLVVAYFVGAFANHALFVMIHECSHNMVFEKRYLNSCTGILANLPQIIPSAVSFQRYHIKHHAFQGIYELDADLPNYWEARLVKNSALGKALWLLFFPFFQATRPVRLRDIKMMDKWIAVNWLVQIAFDVAIFYFWGPKSFFYLLLSLFFGIGLHPLGARWIQRHYIVNGPEQETYSYYGILNHLAFNVGYHNEHHDFPSIPWNRLPELKKIAPQWYESLNYHTSWTKLLFRFIFDKDLSLFSRVVRSERGKVKLDDQSEPDKDLLRQPESDNPTT